jgi:virulence factor
MERGGKAMGTERGNEIRDLPNPPGRGRKKRKLDVLVVGCGSIGRRRIENLLNVPQVARVYVYTRRKSGLTAVRAGKRVQPVDSLDAVNVDCAFVCNETFQHVETALALAERGIPLFIEKPLSHSLADAEKLRRVVRRRRLPVYVAYNLRFLGAIQYVRTPDSQIGVICRYCLGPYLLF